MNNDLENKKNRLLRKRKIMDLLVFIGWFLSFYVSVNAMVLVLPMTEIMLILLGVNNINRDILLSLMEFFYRYLPTIIFIGGKIKVGSISKEILQLEEFSKSSLDSSVMEDIEVKIKDEEEILKVYDIVERFEMLPREKQMEVLNFIKDDSWIKDNQLCFEIEELNDVYKNMLQIECEDILFPDFEEDDLNYSKKRKK